MVKESLTNHGTLHFSVNMSGKMEGINSFSTSVLCNPICQARQNIEGSICQKCFAETTCNRYTNLAKNLEENFDIITNYILDDEVREMSNRSEEHLFFLGAFSSCLTSQLFNTYQQI